MEGRVGAGKLFDRRLYQRKFAMTEYQVDLGKANFKFDLDLLEHISTDLPQVLGGPNVFFDHQQARGV